MVLTHIVTLSVCPLLYTAVAVYRVAGAKHMHSASEPCWNVCKMTGLSVSPSHINSITHTETEWWPSVIRAVLVSQRKLWLTTSHSLSAQRLCDVFINCCASIFSPLLDTFFSSFLPTYTSDASLLGKNMLYHHSAAKRQPSEWAMLYHTHTRESD